MATLNEKLLIKLNEEKNRLEERIEFFREVYDQSENNPYKQSTAQWEISKLSEDLEKVNSSISNITRKKGI